MRFACDTRVDILLSMLTREEQAELGLEEEERRAVTLGLEFVRLPVPDYTVPVVQRVAPTFEMLAAKIGQGRSVAIHCRMGIGRSTLAAASVLTLLGWSPDDAWALVQGARGLPVPDTDAQRQWVYEFARLHAGWRPA